VQPLLVLVRAIEVYPKNQKPQQKGKSHYLNACGGKTGEGQFLFYLLCPEFL
jgi:hypothetical protein